MQAHVDAEIVEPETGQVWGPKSFATPQIGSIRTIAHLPEFKHVKKHSAGNSERSLLIMTGPSLIVSKSP